MEMKKTSVYLSDVDRERLARLAERKGESQAWVIREALLAYDASMPPRKFAIFDAWKDTPPGAIPDFGDDHQAFSDWVHKVVGEAMEEDYERQMRELDDWIPQR